MPLELYQPPESRVLWRVSAFGRQRVPPGRPYWFDNADRTPAGSVVLQVTLGGRMVLRDARGEHAVGPGQLVTFTYGEPTSYGLPAPSDEPYVCQWVNLEGAGLPEHLAVFRRMHGPVIDLGPGRPLLHEMDELMSLAAPRISAGDVDVANAVHRLVMHLFHHAERSVRETLTPVERAVEELLRHPTRPWSLKQVADRYGISREHLSRVFHQRVGRTPAAFLGQARLDHALRLLEQTDLPMAAIAEQAGYASVHTMARQVRQATGCAPTMLRDRRRVPKRRGRR